MLHLQIGTLIYVQVVKANPGMNPELSCTDASGIAAEFGGLKDGYMFPCTMGLSRMYVCMWNSSFGCKTKILNL
ncbi:hypothetical protein glysoja_029597 [Glycine soja]|uniref:Exosome complex component rrp40 n=1 Tax=Glycine soja TaxID=3848 RepID=A0A0B2R2P1_GLYSO|nr:hypothetical protein glysoja_029597 [Glycine soja]